MHYIYAHINRRLVKWCMWKYRKFRRQAIGWLYRDLIRLGVDPSHAYAFSRTRKGGWAVAQSPIMTTTITLERLRKRGYESLLDYYEKVAPQLNEPLFR